MAKAVTQKVATGRGRSALRKADAVDAHVGMRLRIRRTLLGLNQANLAQMLGITSQQVQKYENGDNRISASRLYQLATLLEVPVAWFFDGATASMVPQIAAYADREERTEVERPAPLSAENFNNRDGLDLLKLYYSVLDQKMQRKLVEVARALAEDRS
jgi:transcriptional regulator with XRE-family HTH domain